MSLLNLFSDKKNVAMKHLTQKMQDTLLRDSGYSLGSTPASGVGGGAPPPPELVTSYAYNPTDGRLSSISNPQLSNVSFGYTYVPNSNLIKTITGPAHTVTNTYEQNRNTLDVKENKAGTTLISQYDYTVNALGQRSNVAQTGTAFASSRDIAWAYDPLGQVTSADSTIPGLDRAYAFDMIGNRLRAATGSIDPNDPAAATYTPNALNQYSQITNNSITNNPAFDADGNMTSGPLPANVNANSTLVWDGENRLIQAQITGGATVNFTYDSQSRRIAETVGTNTKLTVYDGWNPIAEYAIQNSTFTIQNSYLWGIDLSGTLQGAGGVGGLLMTSLITNNSITSNYFPTYDGNGNVSEYLNESGEVSAHYEYDPFGKTTVATGPEANDFAHRFSTKPLDLTTGLYYYGYRFYDPVTGRWPSRDPIQERGGLNLYGFVRNDALGTYDILGYAPPGKKLPGQGKKKKGKGCPNDGQKPTAGADGKAEDSAGSKCCPDKMTKVTLYVEDGDSKAKVGSQAASGDGISSGHTFLGVGNGDQGNQDVTGFYPGGGFWGKPGRYEDDSDHNYTDKCDYWACPDTLESLEDDIEDDLDDERAGNCRDYNLLGTQCTTWAKEKLKNAGFPWPGGRTPAQTANQL